MQRGFAANWSTWSKQSGCAEKGTGVRPEARGPRPCLLVVIEVDPELLAALPREPHPRAARGALRRAGAYTHSLFSST